MKGQRNCRNFTLEDATHVATSLKAVATTEKPNEAKCSAKKEVWLSVEEVATLLNTTKRTVQRQCKKGNYKFKWVKAKGGKGGKKQSILLTSLPSSARGKYWSENLKDEVFYREEVSPASEIAVEMEILSSAPEHAKKKADKYINILKLTEGMKKKEIEDFLKGWNKRYPAMSSAYPSVMAARKKYEKYGVSGLLAGYGKRSGETIIKDQWFEYYKGLYLKEGKPSVKSCWNGTLGFARKLDPSLEAKTFPHPQTFDKRLKTEIPESAIYLARYGKDAWNRKYANYIDRDYGKILPGECYVSDHAQLDVAAALPNGKCCFPWVTAWRDFKSGKWVGWLLHAEGPNADHIFQSFYYACKFHGLPTDVYIDNGKDYRCRDFAGGRKKSGRLEVDEIKTSTSLAIMGIAPHFSIPYNAQSKSIERDFNKNKELFSKHLPGYRGGDVTERPEILQAEIKKGKILEFQELSKAFDGYIENILNKMPVSGKIHRGQSPDELWEKEKAATRKVSPDSLKLFCMRTSTVKTIGRNGVKDSEFDCHYWDEWMAGCKGMKVYLRRDVKSWQDAWVFNAENDEFMGRAEMTGRVPALARTEVEKAQLKQAMEAKNSAAKREKAFLKDIREISHVEKLSSFQTGVEARQEARGYKKAEETEKIVALVPNKMDEAVRKSKRMEKEEEEKQNRDYSILLKGRTSIKETPTMFYSDLMSTEDWKKHMGYDKEVK